MIKKSKFYTMVLVLLTFAVVFGGWFLTVKLLKQREERFLSGRGTLSLNTPEIALSADSKKGNFTGKDTEKAAENGDLALGDGAGRESDEERTGFQGTAMSEHRRAMVLLVWDKAENEVIHEPEADQINMEQAIETGQNWIKSMAGHGKIPEKLKDYVFEDTYASLQTPRSKVQFYPEFDKDLFGYWRVQFEGEGISVCLKIHAASGEIWYADFSVKGLQAAYAVDKLLAEAGSGAGGSEEGSYTENEVQLTEFDDTEKLLERAFPFMKQNGESREIVTDLHKNTVYQIFPEGLIYAAFRQYDLFVEGQENVTVTVFWIGREEEL